MSEAGKGDTRRPCIVSPEEADLRWQYLRGEIDEDELYRKLDEL